MVLSDKIKKILRLNSSGRKEINPAKAYNLWAHHYDAQPDNLMLAIESKAFSALLSTIEIKDKVIVDVGCGTGRHWQEILNCDPASLCGYDVSVGMLAKLKEKYPDLPAYQLHNYRLPASEDESVDMIITTLTIAHIEKLDDALKEWCRVLKPGGEVVITDYHPDALANNGDRTFTYKNKLIAIKNYVHSLEWMKATVASMGLQLLQLDEYKIDDPVKVFYERKNAIHVFEKFKGTNIVYGMRLRKQYDTA
jgi:ubiquinone/menaquinone biosynthesis C-methylase UbiE